MKHVTSNGWTLEVRDAGPVRYKMTATMERPLPIVHHEFMEDDAARELVLRLRAEGYQGENVT